MRSAAFCMREMCSRITSLSDMHIKEILFINRRLLVGSF
nr:MAG TPA_asm: hypothetical protein [Caudoviricetes sp.]